jgi:uncharacterized protein YndB with AHSA1/START domain
MSETNPRFVYVSVIDATPETLWTALTNAEFTRRYWFDTSVESDWRVGAPVIYRRQGRVTDEGILLVCEPPRRLSYTFRHLLDPAMRQEPPSRVTFELEPLGPTTQPQGRGVRLTVTHEDFIPGSAVFRGVSAGWPCILSSVKTLLETGRALELAYED